MSFCAAPAIRRCHLSRCRAARASSQGTCQTAQTVAAQASPLNVGCRSAAQPMEMLQERIRFRPVTGGGAVQRPWLALQRAKTSSRGSIRRGKAFHRCDNGRWLGAKRKRIARTMRTQPVCGKRIGMHGYASGARPARRSDADPALSK
ncbi:hypothetical protein Bcep1808_5030 [Burkholderia vietnamiensis G4]|uniref:Uncharacterized protein n=1 Tax=Burkholderia vietnamiensis (strain G4 / LMG 22486) TaxID=269482 RepID=A4JNX8_BURVG|nr:hypothetical protein Bcep1808_5030 [Burkholderia vietnamiensis G4]